jgi:hypothetical protein
MFEPRRVIAKVVTAALLLATCAVFSACGADASLTIIQTPTPAPSPTATPGEG